MVGYRNINLGEIGRTGLTWSAGSVYEEFLPALSGSRGRKIYREMADNDAIVGAFLYAIEQIIREVRWSVKPGDDKDAQSKKDAFFLQTCMNSMSHSWADLITEILSMFTYGWALFEQVFEKKNGAIIWKKISIRSQDSLEAWDLDENGGIKGMYQRTYPDFKLSYLPLSKCLLFRTKLNKDNPEGRSILRNSFRSFYFKKNIQEIEGIGIERDLAGIPVLTAPDGFNIGSEKEEDQLAIAWAKDIITNVRNDEQAGLFLPHGWEFELLASPGQKQFNTTEIINRYNKEIAVTVLAQFIMLGMERTGSYALAKEQTSMFYLALDGWVNSIGSIFNRYAVPLLFGLNGQSFEVRPQPHIVHTIIGQPSLRDVASYVSALANEKVNALVIDDEVRTYLKNYAKLREFSDVTL